jgi:hypothetical protein
MNTRRLLWRSILTLALFASIGGTLSCGQEVQTGPRAWIDFPRDKSSVPVGTPVSVISHAYARDGVAEVLLSIDGEAYRRDPPAQPGASFSEVTQEWLPQEEGIYTLQVVTYDANGETSNPAMISIRVVGEVALLPTDTPTPLPDVPDLAIVSVEAVVEGYKGEVPFCNTRVTYRNAGTAAVPSDFTIQFHFDGVPQLAMTVAGGLPPGASAEATFVYQFDGSPYIGINLDSTDVIVESNEANNAFAEMRLCSGTPPITPTFTPTPTGTPEPPTPTHTPTATPWPPVQVDLRVDDTSLVQGECTTLRWDVEYATAVYLNGGGIPGHGTQQVCPASTTTYDLHVEAPGGNVDRSVTINVSAPPDTQGPDISGLKSSEGSIDYSCEHCAIPCKTDISANVTDKSGVAWVKLIYKPPNQEERSGGMANIGGASYKATINANGWSAGTLEFWVRAQDNKGNVSESGHRTLTVEDCVW